MTEEEKEARAREKEREEQNRKKDSHIKRMDEMKRLMINQIMQRGNLYDQRFMNRDFYEEDCVLNQEASIQRHNISRDQEYFKELSKSVEAHFIPTSDKCMSLKVANFILRIAYVDRMLNTY